MRFKLFAAMMLLMTVGVVCGQAVESVQVGDPASQAPRTPAWVEARIQELLPTAEERRFDEIGWTHDLRAAIRLGRQHRRPVFLFTHDGAIATGRC